MQANNPLHQQKAGRKSCDRLSQQTQLLGLFTINPQVVKQRRNMPGHSEDYIRQSHSQHHMGSGGGGVENVSLRSSIQEGYLLGLFLFGSIQYGRSQNSYIRERNERYERNQEK